MKLTLKTHSALIAIALSHASLPAFAADELLALGDLAGGSFGSYAGGVSADGSVVAGQSRSANGWEAFRWENGVMSGLGSLGDTSFLSIARGISADGSVVVGHSGDQQGILYEAFRWTQAGGMVGLGDLEGGSIHSEARGVSADGSAVVGSSSSAASDVEAFRWTQADGMVV